MNPLLNKLFRSGKALPNLLPGARSDGEPEKGRDTEGARDLIVAAERAADEREMIQGVRELGQTTVKEVMVPRIDTVFLAMESERDELLEKVVSCGHSRIPVYGDTIDSVVGVLYAKDLLRVLVKG